LFQDKDSSSFTEGFTKKKVETVVSAFTSHFDGAKFSSYYILKKTTTLQSLHTAMCILLAFAAAIFSFAHTINKNKHRNIYMVLLAILP